MRWFRRQNRDEELERELRSDLEAEAEELRGTGMPVEQARYAAVRAFGNLTRVKEDVRQAWGGIWFEEFVKDIRYAARDLRKSPGFATTAVLSLALGIGANTAVFTILNAVLLKSLPVRDPEGLVVLGPARGSGDETGMPRDGSFSLYSYDLYQQLRSTHVFSSVCALRSSTEMDFSIRGAGWSDSERGQAELVSGSYFAVLGVNAALGRTIEASDDSGSAPPVAVVSFRYWKNRLGGDASVLGSNISIGNVPFTIVGVMPAGFYGETLRPDPPDFWLPLSAERQLFRENALLDRPDTHWLYVIGRLAPGISKAQAEVRLNVVLRNWLLLRAGSQISTNDRAEIMTAHIELTPGGSGIAHMQREYALTLRLLFGISIAVLLITCANIANLLLARGTAKTGEMSLRLAMGASRWRLTRQLITESLTLALAGGALGLCIAIAGTKLLIALFFRGSAYVPIESAPDLRVLAFTFVLSCLAALVFGLLPTVRTVAQGSLMLKGASAGVTGTGAKGSRLSSPSFGLGAALIVVEVALSVIVLTGAGAFARSLANVSNQQFGFDRDRVLVIHIDTLHADYQYSRLGTLYRDLYSRLNSIPGIQSASFSDYSPFDQCCWAFSVSVQGYTPKPQEETRTLLNRVSPRYFQTLGTRVLFGRTVDEHDSPGSHAIAIVSREFVRRFLPNQNPIGRRFGIGGPRHASDFEIIGVVEDAKYEDPRDELIPMAFFPLLQPMPGESPASPDESNFVNVIEVRTKGRPEAVSAEVRRTLADVDSRLPVLQVGTLSDTIELTLNQENVTATMATFFGFVALALSCLGLYGLMAYTVQRRTAEIGIRVALGAQRLSVVRMMMREALLQASTGLLVGVPAAIAAMRLVSNQLYGVSQSDPKYAAGGAVMLLLCVMAAACLPAARAARIDPLLAIRYE